MSRWLPIAIAALLGGLLASCATLSEDQCKAGDWRSIGVADGVEGRPADYLSNHVDACAQYGIGIDRTLYQAGRAEGLRAYCGLDVAATEGLAGEPYYGVCEGDLGVAFARIHTAARRVHQLEAERNSIDSEIRSLIAQLAQGNVPEPQAAQLAAEIRSLERERNSVERQMRLGMSRLSAIQAEERLRLSRSGG